MSNPMSLAGKRILVTGASSGIGAACAQVIAELGASVVLVARSEAKLASVMASLPNSAKHTCLSFDLGDVDSIGALVDLIASKGRLDGFVHSAGVMPLMPIGMLKKETVRAAFEVNYLSFMELMRFCSKSKVRNPSFSVVAISSVSSEVGWPLGAVYCGTKGALCSSVRSLALELATRGVRVNAVSPSNIKTPLHDVEQSGLEADDFYRALSAKQPLGLGDPRQVANAVAFLLSDAASFITGVNLPVDGGYLAQ